MRNRMLVLGILLLFAAGLSGPASAQSRLGFKLGGGLAYVGGGDFNKGVQGLSDFLYDFFTLLGVTATGGFQPVHLGLDLQGELIFQITPEMGIGLGAGYMSLSRASEMSVTAGTATEKEAWHPRASIIPITLNFHYSIPAGASLKFNIHAGAGYYLAGLKDTQHLVLFVIQDDEYDTSGSGLGVHGGVGLEIALSPNVGFTFDILGRFASISPIKGDLARTIGGMTSRKTGATFWYAEQTLAPLGTYPYLSFDSVAPSGAGIANVREAKLDLSGFSAVAGFIFRF